MGGAPSPCCWLSLCTPLSHPFAETCLLGAGLTMAPDVFWLVLSSFFQARQGTWARSFVQHTGVEGGGCWWGGHKLGL